MTGLMVTVRPGPTLHVWWQGCEIASVPLTPHAALALAESLLREVRAALGRGEVATRQNNPGSVGHLGDGKMPPATADLCLRRAEIRLAEEYDAAQARGEVAGHGQRGPEKDVGVHNVFWRTDLVGSNNEVRPATAADLGLRRGEIHHEARND